MTLEKYSNSSNKWLWTFAAKHCIKWTAKSFPCDILSWLITYDFKRLPLIYYMAFILQKWLNQNSFWRWKFIPKGLRTFSFLYSCPIRSCILMTLSASGLPFPSLFFLCALFSVSFCFKYQDKAQKIITMWFLTLWEAGLSVRRSGWAWWEGEGLIE